MISSEDLLSAAGPRTPSAEHAILEESSADVAATATGHLTPPELFPPKPGCHTEDIDMDAGTPEDATPRPQHIDDADVDPTPRAASHPDA